MPRHHAPHTPYVGPILLLHDENTAYVMPRGTAHAVTSCTHQAARAHWTPAILIKCGVPEITYGRAVHASQTIFIKINRLTF